MALSLSPGQYALGFNNLTITVMGGGAGGYTYAYVDVSGGPQTYTLPAGPSLNSGIIVFDSTGHSATNNITVNGNGHTINGSATFTIFQNFASVGFIWNGTEWKIF